MLIEHKNRGIYLVRLSQTLFVVEEICSELGCSNSIIKKQLEDEYDLWLQADFCNVKKLSAIKFKKHLKKLAIKLLKKELSSEFKHSSKSKKTFI